MNITDIHAERPLKGYPALLRGQGRPAQPDACAGDRTGAGGARQCRGAGRRSSGRRTTGDFPPAERAAIVEHTLLKRVGSPADIARTVKFLIFDAPYITGQVINVDGGRTAHLMTLLRS